MEANDISSMLGVLLQNKELMNSVKAAVSANKTEEKPSEPEGETASENVTDEVQVAETENTVEVSERSGPTAVDRRCLIEALEPFLSPERRETAKKLLLAVELLSADKLFGGR